MHATNLITGVWKTLIPLKCKLNDGQSEQLGVVNLHELSYRQRWLVCLKALLSTTFVHTVCYVYRTNSIEQNPPFMEPMGPLLCS